MATLTKHHSDLSTIQRRGLKLVLVGLLVFASWPVFRLAGIVRLTGLQLGLFIIAPYGACVLVWGLYVLRTGTERPLTPTSALWIPILVVAMFAVVDLLTRGELYQFWEYFTGRWPDLPLGTLARNVPYLGMIGSSTFVVLGVAVRMQRQRAVIAAIGLVLSFVWLVFQYNTLGQAVFGLALIGSVPFAIGFRAANPAEFTTSPAEIIMELSPIEWRGVKLTAVGLLMFAAFPVLRLVGVLEWGGGGLWVLLLSTYGACILVWGIYVLRTKTQRPLTPKRALLIPLLVAVMTVATDLLTRGRLIEWWIDSQPQGVFANLDVFGYRFRQSLHIGASTYVVLGAAIRSEKWPWVLTSVGLILGISWLLELIPGGSWMFLLVAILGIVPAIIGYRATAPPDE